MAKTPASSAVERYLAAPVREDLREKMVFVEVRARSERRRSR